MRSRKIYYAFGQQIDSYKLKQKQEYLTKSTILICKKTVFLMQEIIVTTTAVPEDREIIPYLDSIKSFD